DAFGIASWLLASKASSQFQCQLPAPRRTPWLLGFGQRFRPAIGCLRPSALHNSDTPAISANAQPLRRIALRAISKSDMDRKDVFRWRTDRIHDKESSLQSRATYRARWSRRPSCAAARPTSGERRTSQPPCADAPHPLLANARTAAETTVAVFRATVQWKRRHTIGE